MKTLLVVLFLCLGMVRAAADQHTIWCSKGYGKPAVLITTHNIGILYIQGEKPRWRFEGFQAVIGNTDMADLDGSDIWIIEDRFFRVCPDQTLPSWVHVSQHTFDDTISLVKSGIRPAGDPK